MNTDALKSQRRSFDEPDERRKHPRKLVDEVRFQGVGPVLRERFEPGWVWSETTGKTAATDLCEKPHVGYCLEGQMAFSDRDGKRLVVGPGDVFYMAAGHDAETVGDVDCVWLEFAQIKGA